MKRSNKPKENLRTNIHHFLFMFGKMSEKWAVTLNQAEKYDNEKEPRNPKQNIRTNIHFFLFMIGNSCREGSNTKSS